MTYTVLLGGAAIANNYRVSGYPTTYLIDKNGKIIFTQTGYSKDTESELEEMILKNLLSLDRSSGLKYKILKEELVKVGESITDKRISLK